MAKPRILYLCDDGTKVPVVLVSDPVGPEQDDGTFVCIGEESGKGSLWIDWAHHGEIDIDPKTDLVIEIVDDA